MTYYDKVSALRSEIITATLHDLVGRTLRGEFN